MRRRDGGGAWSNTSMETELSSGEALREEILGSLKDLPPMPQVVFKAREVLADPNAGMRDLTHVIENDPAMASKVLRIANSAFFGMSGRVSSLQQATVLLGAKILGKVITMAGITGLLGKSLPGYQLKSGDLWRHSVAVATGSDLIAAKVEPRFREDAFVAGLLHDNGKIILEPHVRRRQGIFSTYIEQDGLSMLEAEIQILGFDHAHIAAEACQRWNFPAQVTRAIRYHHTPAKAGEERLPHILYVANHIARLSGGGLGNDDLMEEMDQGALSFLGLSQGDVGDFTCAVTDALSRMTE
jgi:HD-like signal output (HDOD) protein